MSNEDDSHAVWESDTAAAPSNLPAPIDPSAFRTVAPPSPSLGVHGYSTTFGDLDPYAPSQNAWEDQVGRSSPIRTASPRTLGSIVTPSSRLELLPDLDDPPLPSPSPSSSSSRTLPIPPPIEREPPPTPAKGKGLAVPDSPKPGAFIGMFRTASGSGSIRSNKGSSRSQMNVGAEEEKERLRSEYLNEKESLPSPTSPSSPVPNSPPAVDQPSSSSLSNPLASIASAFRAATSSPPQSASPSRGSPPGKSEKRPSVVQRENRGKDQENEKGRARETTTEVVFDFARFMEQMRMRSADPVAKYLKSFLKEFSRKPPISSADQIRVVNDFLDFIAGKMRDVDPWKELLAGPDVDRAEDEFDMAMEAMEKLVMNRLYHLTFTPALDLSRLPGHVSPTDDLERDQVLTQRIRLFSWIEPHHLDLPVDPTSPPASTSVSAPDISSLSIAPSAAETESEKSKQKQPESREPGSSKLDAQGFLDFASRELLKINQYKAPRDKLICILNSCKVIFGLIRHVSNEEGADAFIPFLIYVVLKSNPAHLVSNIQFIQRFRNPEKLSGEGGYYLSSLNGAVSFIETMDSGSLSNITQLEFETYVEQAIQNLPTDPAETILRGQPRTAPPSGSSTPTRSGRQSNATTNDLAHATDIDSPALIQQPGVSLTEATKAFFLRSTDSVERAVSKPLGAIGKILDKFDEQQPPLDRQPSVLGPRRTYETYTARRPAPARSNSRSSMRSSRSNASAKSDPHAGLYVPDGMDADEVSKEIDRQHELQRLAAIETLSSIFPQIESEVLEMVLLSAGDIALAIDAVLDMS